MSERQLYGTGTYTCNEYWCEFGSESYSEWRTHRAEDH